MLTARVITDIIDRLFADSKLVKVKASPWSIARNMGEVEIIPYDDEPKTIAAAVAEIQSLVVVRTVSKIGKIKGTNGEEYLLTFELHDWRIGSDGRFYRH